MQEQGFGKGRAGSAAVTPSDGGSGTWRVPPLLDERLWPEVKGDYSREREIQRERRSTCPERLAKSATDGSLGGDAVVVVYTWHATVCECCCRRRRCPRHCCCYAVG